ncbi:23S rRNA (guanosine(2251)-2'-O)-methyltransferase RlmB [Athalassotoga saccharophila]|uniref:23S rRNA (guanosine(2251)-2'-O)-methyltransferase RlmB n=1 Tax=Athalassotoga saccharophila TaxID=1441386 RepID=UPI00137AF2E6|nr:23S rRNA (guanosine(2251)-2'-O)-methyltransferase RlmB [Athalassotoga saccharophila]BBJ27748.1 23S rRNA (guanosine-2'-O-)-methyltransferase RlmB [Athalassotoga saccharophila]
MIIYGRNVIEEALKIGIHISKVFISDVNSSEMKRLRDEIEKRNIRIEILDDRKIDEIAHSRDHQGIAAKIKDFLYSDTIKTLDGIDHDPFIVILDQVQDPQNFGAIIRTAYGAGVDLIIIPKDGSVHVTPAVLKSSAGYAFRMPICIEVNIARTIEILKERNIWVYAAMMEGKPYFSMDFKGPIAFVFGNEGKGIRRLVAEKCDDKVSIPMAREMDSLNVSVSAAVILFKAMEMRNDSKVTR